MKVLDRHLVRNWVFWFCHLFWLHYVIQVWFFSSHHTNATVIFVNYGPISITLLFTKSCDALSNINIQFLLFRKYLPSNNWRFERTHCFFFFTSAQACDGTVAFSFYAWNSFIQCVSWIWTSKTCWYNFMFEPIFW